MSRRTTFAYCPLLLCALASSSPAAAADPPGPLAQAQARVAPLLAERARSHVASRLWQAPLDYPVALHDPAASRTVLGRAQGWVPVALPQDTPPANTCIELEGGPAALLVLPLPQDRDELRRLLWHERWHCAQARLGLAAGESPNAHLDRESGRTWLRLELRALARAVASDDDGAARRHAVAALAFRRARTAGDTAAAAGEVGLERNEGLAEYTGWRVAYDESGALHRELAARLARADAQDSYLRSFAYFTGPAYGVLLDRWWAGWRTAAVSGGADLPRMLSGVLDAHGGDGDARALARRYGGAQVAAEERDRASRRARQDASLRARFVDGPVLRLPLRHPSVSFDPRSLFALDGEGTWYATLTVRDAWGELSAPRGALLADDWRSVRVAAPDLRGCGARWSSADGGWQLRLAPGWTLRRDRDGRPRLEQAALQVVDEACGPDRPRDAVRPRPALSAPGHPRAAGEPRTAR